jgi:hypothetical protein
MLFVSRSSSIAASLIVWLKKSASCLFALCGDALRRLPTFEMPLQQMPNQSRRTRPALALGVELGFEILRKLNVESLHLHRDPPLY